SAYARGRWTSDMEHRRTRTVHLHRSVVFEGDELFVQELIRRPPRNDQQKCRRVARMERSGSREVARAVPGLRRCAASSGLQRTDQPQGREIFIPAFVSGTQSQSVLVHLAGTGLPLVGSGLEEEPTNVPQRFIPSTPENGFLSAATSGSTCALVANVRVNPSTPALITRSPPTRPRSLIASACELEPKPRFFMPVAGVQTKATGWPTRRSDTPTMTSELFTALAWLLAPPSVCKSTCVPSRRQSHACAAEAPAAKTQPTMSPLSLMPSAWLTAPGGLRSVICPDASERTAWMAPIASSAQPTIVPDALIDCARLALPPRSASGCMPLPSCQTNARLDRKSLVKAKPTIAPESLMPLASEDGRPGRLPSSVRLPAGSQLTANEPLNV